MGRCWLYSYLNRSEARCCARLLRGAFVHGCRRGEFRICQFSIQGNHFHLICEASDSGELARGTMNGNPAVMLTEPSVNAD